MIGCVLSVVVDSGVLEGGGVSSATRENCVAFVNVFGLNAGGAATAVPVNNILSIVSKFVFIHLNLLNQHNSSNCCASIGGPTPCI